MRQAFARVRLEGALWRNRDFLWLWTAQSISQLGSEITGLALPLVAILVLDASTFAVAALSVVAWAPLFAFSLPAGVWIDRLPRRPLMIVADWGRALLLATVPAAYFLDALTLGQLYAVALAGGTLTMLFDLTYQSYLPTVVERGDLGEGNSKLEVSRSAAHVVGPGLAGVLVSALTAPYAILLDAVSFVASALSLGRIRRPETPPARATKGRQAFWADLVEGLRFTLPNPIQRPIIVFVAGSNFFTNILFALYLVYAVRELELSATTIGLILSIGSIGSLIGALTANRFARWLGIGPALIAVSAAGGLGQVLVPLASGPLTIPFLVAANVLFGFFVLNYFVTAVSLVQAVTPDHLLGRANASRRFVVQSMIPLGALVGGVLGTLIGLRPTIAIGAIGAAVAVLHCCSPRFAGSRRLSRRWSSWSRSTSGSCAPRSAAHVRLSPSDQSAAAASRNGLDWISSCRADWRAARTSRKDPAQRILQPTRPPLPKPLRKFDSCRGHRPAGRCRAPRLFTFLSPRAVASSHADLRRGPLFSEAERAWLDALVAQLRSEGFECFVPHENFSELTDLTSREVFRVDAAGVRGANVLLAWLDGPVVDDGTACEIGMFAELVASGDERYVGIVGLVTDLRLQRRRGNTVGDGMNLFVTGAIEASGRVCWSVDEAVDALRELEARSR